MIKFLAVLSMAQSFSGGVDLNGSHNNSQERDLLFVRELNIDCSTQRIKPFASSSLNTLIAVLLQQGIYC